MDEGADGLTSTLSALSRLEIKAAGCGPDLTAARAPALIGERPRRVALLSIAASADPATRALDRQGIIAGRPGVSTLRYRVELHAEAAAFDALSRAAGTQVKGPDELSVFGTRVLRSPKTRFEFIANEEDVAHLVTGIRTARRDADVVIVAVHAHEPINASLHPAGFVQQLARAAIDAGAQVVVGHGPHQLRGVERYKEGVILYSMGDFLSQRGAAIGKTTDAFDAGLDLEAVAIGAARVRGTLIQEPMAEPEWSESAIAVATFEGSGLKSLELIPLDLGLDRGASDRGLPQVAHGPTAARILSRLERLSSEFMTTVERRGDRMSVRLN
jgi:poly-gamma-glutamate synthesis protein (capsule biosynthesis protein)